MWSVVRVLARALKDCGFDSPDMGTYLGCRGVFIGGGWGGVIEPGLYFFM